ncbi:hypothetical protein PoB_006671700 [Plakobranchus ocellatus]|uniref:Uncharacterized protein n=1 Tax=Plakobranchus ocellatus TaxID=259542 RepID=A0AAV4D7T8_9GAST|nr:hypothetical protein PoB_006671700 [Plakobranchus ocellatus]
MRVEILLFHFGQQFVFLVRQQHNLHIRVTRTRHVFGRKVLGLDNPQGQGQALEVVVEAQLEGAQLVVHALHERPCCFLFHSVRVLHEHGSDRLDVLPHTGLAALAAATSAPTTPVFLRRRAALAVEARTLVRDRQMDKDGQLLGYLVGNSAVEIRVFGVCLHGIRVFGIRVFEVCLREIKVFGDSSIRVCLRGIKVFGDSSIRDSSALDSSVYVSCVRD